MAKTEPRAGGEHDHRTRVGRQRATRTEARLLEAALRVFAEKGPDAPVVDDFALAAGISRGTFYNYFDGVPALLEATSRWTSGATVKAIDLAMGGLEDPAQRVGTGFRLFLGRARLEPVWALFIARVWKLGDLAALAEDLARGRASGQFRFASVDVALDVLLGGAREALFRIAEGRAPPGYVEQLVGQQLVGLGVPPARAAEVLRLPLPAPNPPPSVGRSRGARAPGAARGARHRAARRRPAR